MTLRIRASGARQAAFTGWMVGLAVLVPAHANAGAVKLGIEPIVGYEHVQKLLPTVHSTNRIVYGARLTVGVLLLSLEAEYTRGTDTEEYPAESLSVKDMDDKLKVGLRSGFRLSRLLMLSARGGGQAKQNVHTETVSGVSTVTTAPIVYKPYAGAEFRAALSSKISASAGVTVVFNDIKKMEQNEYQTTAGFQIRLP